MFVCGACVSFLLACGCGTQRSESPANRDAAEKKTANKRLLSVSGTDRVRPKTGPRPAVPHLSFVDVHRQLGLDFSYDNGAQGKSLMIETTGGGVGWLDFDGDGVWDLYLVQGGEPLRNPTTRLKLNQLMWNRDSERFENVASRAGVADGLYGQGVTVGDFNNDGFDDIYVTNYGDNILYRNQGDGTFESIAAEAGVGDSRWSTGAAWGDLDLDGDLDLFVCNYLKFDINKPVLCRTKLGGRAYICHPKEFAAVHNECFLNNGDGTFQRIAGTNGLRANNGKSLGVVIADLTNDGLPDIYVANDTTANFLFVNKGNARFEESAVRLGCAINDNGQYEASMGIALGDYDGNGFLDLYLTHFTEESNTLYSNHGVVGFQDSTVTLGLQEPTIHKLGFGTVMADFNQDGRQELLVTNGHIDDRPGKIGAREMSPQCFTFDGDRWLECQCGRFFKQRFIGRGLAVADYDNDGDYDVAIVHQHDQMAILKNESQRGNWLGVQLVGRTSNRRAIGARLIVTQNGMQQVYEIVGGASYCSSNQPIALFGFGDFDQTCQLTIRWPCGIQQKLDDIRLNQSLQLIEPVR